MSRLVEGSVWAAIKDVLTSDDFIEYTGGLLSGENPDDPDRSFPTNEVTIYMWEGDNKVPTQEFLIKIEVERI